MSVRSREPITFALQESTISNDRPMGPVLAPYSLSHVGIAACLSQNHCSDGFLLLEVSVLSSPPVLYSTVHRFSC